MKEDRNRRKIQFQYFELVIKQNTEIRVRIGDIEISKDQNKIRKIFYTKTSRINLVLMSNT